MNPQPIRDPHEPGEIVTAESARELTDRIKECAEKIWKLIGQAYLSRAWAALSYRSWDEYCANEFDGVRIKIPREERSEVVASLREIGMSTRAIAAATGLDRGTVRKDLSQVDENHPPAGIVGKDGKAYSPKPIDSEQIPPDVEADFLVLEEPHTRTGRAAKSSPAPKRKPITESFDMVRRELVKNTASLTRLLDDNRFDRYAAQIAHRHRSDLERALQSLQAALNRLPENITDQPEGEDPCTS
ncbi:hypothetical protein AB0N05_15020 [Nocardia sp. NPDC051030]|uniref:hypothetical protein n=1 Tax=Nocardia sp. NPDC051030 TaxID=3155162 RepID=UPI00343C91DE